MIIKFDTAKGVKLVNYEVKISDDGTFVCQLPQEDMTMQLASEMSREAIYLARANNTTRFLSDVRGIKNIESPFPNYEFAYRGTSEVGYRKTDRIAVVHDSDDASHDFIETASLNAGYDVKLFTDIQAAIEWLRR